jgi:hypothetical protein
MDTPVAAHIDTATATADLDLVLHSSSATACSPIQALLVVDPTSAKNTTVHLLEQSMSTRAPCSPFGESLNARLERAGR